DDQSQSFVLGDNYTFSPSLIASFHGTVNRTHNYRVVPPYFAPSDLGVNMHNALPGFMGISVASGFALGVGATNPGYFNSTAFQASEDINLIRGSHQIAFGVNYIRAIMNTQNNRPTNGQFTFNSTTNCAGCTGLGLADFLTGTVSGGFMQGGIVYDNDRANFIGLYVQDSWKITRRLTLNYGVRWEPFLPETNRDGYVEHFDPGLFSAGTRSAQYVNSPAGLTYPGDANFPGMSNVNSRQGQFAPRAAVVWDPAGDGKMTIRASYGIFYDTPQLFFYTRFANNPPWGAQISMPLVNFTNPWATYPGGDPFPGLYTVSKNMPFPRAGVYVNMPVNTAPPNVQQWNLSIQRQIGTNLMVAANYFGNTTTHMWTGTEMNPALPVAGATLGSENQHRALYLQNQAEGQYFSTIGMVDDGGKASYNGLLLTAQRRMSDNFSVLTNFTWSHCISDPETTELTGPSYVNPASRIMDRANCSSDRRRIFNFTFIANTPHMANHMANLLVGGWQFSTILRYQSGNFSTITAGPDMNLSGIGSQRPNQVGTNALLAQTAPGSQKFSVQYLNSAAGTGAGINKGAFSTAGLGVGTFGTLGPLNILNPSMIQVDMKLSRVFQVREHQTLELRWEIFNVPNRVNLAAPNTTLSAGTFGLITSDINGSSSQAGDPRIMQLALKYVF
ncbi:MAG: TonB-dependent receptor, partial [Acidobacteriota bacterium]|nr:TonB-dependent receptor [Acidobacteriota bacterium]